MMIVVIVIFLISVTNSANAMVTKTKQVTWTGIATISYGMGEGEQLSCRATAMYDEEKKIGKLVISSSDQADTGPLDVFLKIKNALQNDVIARSYYLSQPLPVRVTMVPEEKGIDSPTLRTEDTVHLQILPNVQSNFFFHKQKGSWNVEIPYRRDDVQLKLNKIIVGMTILSGLNEVFDCAITVVEAEPMWMSLKIKKAIAPDNFLGLRYSPFPIFFEKRPAPEEESAVEDLTREKSVFQATFGFMKELDDEYYAEIRLQVQNTVVVKLTTPGEVDSIRLVAGFINEEKNEIMFHRGSRVLVASRHDPENFVDGTYDVLWSFRVAKMLQVATLTHDGELSAFSDIQFAVLQEMPLKYGKGFDRTFLVLPCRLTKAAQAAAILLT